MEQRHLPRETDPRWLRQIKRDALKAEAWDLHRIVERCVPDLREVGQHELADSLVRHAKDAAARAEEFEAPVELGEESRS